LSERLVPASVDRSYEEKYTGTLIDASNKVGLETIIDKTKYMLLSRHQNVGQNRDIKIGNRSFENVSQFKYLATTVTNQNLIQEEIKMRWSLEDSDHRVCLFVCFCFEFS
jgi:hypothetical protein